jgi:hypothetical protein
MASRFLHSSQVLPTKHLTTQPVQEMSRPKNTIRVSLKGQDGKTTRLNILPAIDGSFVIYRDGKIREKISATEFGKRMATWIKSQAAC